MLRIKELIYDKDISSDEKYDCLLSLMHHLDGCFELCPNGEFRYIPHQIEGVVHGGIISIQHNRNSDGTPLVGKITRNLLDEEVGIAICRRLNFVDNIIAKQVFYERKILARDVRFIKKKYRLGSVAYYSLLSGVKKILIEYMCFDVSVETIELLEQYEQQKGWFC